MIERQAIVIVAIKGRYTSKPRPWVVVQSDDFDGTESVVICALSHSLISDAPLLRIDVEPSAENGLREPSQVAVEKLNVVRRADVSQIIGRLEDANMRRVDAALRGVLGLKALATCEGRVGSDCGDE